ncbi:MAG: PAS domain-containing protein [Myxococcaceae bacterium]|nr:PAS domain-containing protein [Myxococcaceae bacterium]
MSPLAKRRDRARDFPEGPGFFSADLSAGWVMVPEAWRALFETEIPAPCRWITLLRALPDPGRSRLCAAVASWREGSRSLDLELELPAGWVRVAAPPRGGHLMHGLIEDTTKLHHELRELRQSAREVQQRFDRASHGMAWLSSDGKVLRANLAELALLGRTSADYLGHSWASFHVDPPVALELLDRLARGAVVRDAPVVLRRGNGSELHALIDAEPVWRPDLGRVFQLQMRDVTAVRRAEAQAAEIAARLRLAVDAARLGIWELDRARGRVRGDAQVAALLDLPKLVTGMSVMQAVARVHPADQARAAEAASGALSQTTGHIDLEVRVLVGDTERWVSIHGQAVPDALGQVDRTIGVAKDITERRNHEAVLLKALETLQRQVGQNLHDDVGQVLTGLALSTRALEADIPERLKGRMARLVELTNLATQKVREVSRNLVPVHLEHRGVREAITELVKSSRHVLGIEGELELAPTEPETTVDERLHLTLIAREALNNAAKYGAGPVDVRFVNQGDWWTLSIEDHGGGLPADASRKAGLGLKIMEYRARAVGGVLTLDSHPHGLTVRCSFWRSSARQSSPTTGVTT